MKWNVKALIWQGGNFFSLHHFIALNMLAWHANIGSSQMLLLTKLKRDFWQLSKFTSPA